MSRAAGTVGISVHRCEPWRHSGGDYRVGSNQQRDHGYRHGILGTHDIRLAIEQLSTTTATLNVAFAASPQSAGEYCVAIFDTGNVQVSSDFTLTVTHY